MLDRTYKQAFNDVVSQLQKQLTEDVKQRMNFVEKGQTLAEATANLDPRYRTIVADTLLLTHALAIVSTLQAEQYINQKQASELHEILHERLKPRSEND